HLHPHGDTLRRDADDVVVKPDHECRDHIAPSRGQSNPAHTLAAATLTIELVELCALPVAGVCHHQDGGVVAGNITGHDFITGLQCHPSHTGGVSPHGPNVVLAESNRHAISADHEDVVITRCLDDFHKLVAVAQVDSDEAFPAGLVVLAERR